MRLVSALPDLLDFDALAIRTAQGKMVSTYMQVDGVVERRDLADRNLGPPRDAHVHNPPTRLPRVVEFDYTAGFAGSNIVECHGSPNFACAAVISHVYIS